MGIDPDLPVVAPGQALPLFKLQDGAFFEVTNVDVVLEELRGRGLELGPPAIQRSAGGAFRAFFVVAPDGLCFMIGEPVP